MSTASPICSCIICKLPKPSKGINSHYLASHTDEPTRLRLVGNGNRKKPDSTKQKQLAELRQLAYLDTPIYCAQCNNVIPYDKRSQTYCSSSCSAIHSNSKKDWTKIKTGPPKGTSPANKRGPFTPVFQCKICKHYFQGKRVVCDNRACRYENLKGKTGGFRANSTRKTRVIYKGFQLDSGAELAFAQLLDAHNIAWVKNSTVWFEYAPNKKYYPDFFLTDYDQWIEIKGRYYLREDDSLRWKSVPNIEIIWSNDIKLPAVCTGFEPV